MARYWVGGATGFLGSRLVESLLQQGHEVVPVSSSGGQVAGLTVKRCDVLDERQVAESAAGTAGAFLCTGKVSRDPADAEQLFRLHVTGTKTALGGLRSAGVPRVVLASTSGTVAVGEDPDRIFTEADPAPITLIGNWPYYRTKLYAEREALARNEPGVFDVLCVNPSLLLGPGDVRQSSTKDVRLFLEREIAAIPSGGMAFVDARDAANGMLLAMAKGRAGERYLLNAKNMTMAAFFERLSRVSGVPAPLLRVPRGRNVALAAHRAMSGALGWLGRKPAVDEVSVEMAQCYWYCDSAKAERELGFTTRDPGDTLRETVDDLIERGAAFPRRGAPFETPKSRASL